MDYEVDFLAVGEESKSGDAIALRFGNLNGSRDEQTVIIIDGGFSESGKKLQSLINKYYGTNKVDIVILTHPDTDHANGLKYILENMIIKELWMHQPWEHTEDMAQLFSDGRITDNSFAEKLKDNLEAAHQLEQLAFDKGIKIVEPFAGQTDKTACFRILGPSCSYYEELLPTFRNTPKLDESKEEAKGLIAKALEGLKKLIETWFEEKLDDSGETSAENNSSVVSLLTIGNDNFLFTADAGIPALEKVIDELELQGINLDSIKKMQVPHHGSQRNIGPSLLDKLLGSIIGENETNGKQAYLSAAKNGSPKHPAAKVLNAFRRRGTKVFSTVGKNLHSYSSGAPARDDYSTAEPFPFIHEYEA